MAVISVTMQAEQGISGIGLTLFGLGLSSLLMKMLVGTPTGVTGFTPARCDIPGLSDIPILGPLFFSYSLTTYWLSSLVRSPGFAPHAHDDTFGLKFRAVPAEPGSSRFAGCKRGTYRYATVILGGAMAGIAGASLSISILNIFQENMTNGMGFIAVALVYFGGWRPAGIMAGALLFSMVNALAAPGSRYWGCRSRPTLPSCCRTCSPSSYSRSRHAEIRQPAALTKPYERGQ